MAKAYLYLNAVLYLGLAVWCTLRHQQAAASQGYLTLGNAGHSEYLVIYGGLQLGLAAIYAWLGAHPEYHRLGVLLSLFLYAPIVLYRVITVFTFRPVGGLTLGVGILETALLLAALALWFGGRTR